MRPRGDDLGLRIQCLPEAAAARRIQFAEHVVGQQHRPDAAALVKPRRLRQPESEHERPLLAFGGKVPRRRVLHGEMKVIAVRTGQRGAKLPVPGPAGFQPREQRFGRRFGKVRLVGEPSRFGILDQSCVDRRESLLEALEPGRPQRDEPDRRRGERLFEGGEFGFRGGPGLEQAVARGQGPGEGLQGGQVFGVHRSEGQIEPAPPDRGRAAHELQIRRREHHGRKTAEVIGQPGNPILIAPEFLALVPQFDRDVSLAQLLVLHHEGDGRGVMAMAHNELLFRGPE